MLELLKLILYHFTYEIHLVYSETHQRDLSSTQWKIDDRTDKIATLTDKITEAETERTEYEETAAGEIAEIETTIKELFGEYIQTQHTVKSGFHLSICS